MNVKVTSLSSKGQIVIPRDIRQKLHISTGANFFVFTDGSNLLLKPIRAPKLDAFDALIRKSRKLTKQQQLQTRDVSKIIQQVRNENRS